MRPECVCGGEVLARGGGGRAGQPRRVPEGRGERRPAEGRAGGRRAWGGLPGKGRRAPPTLLGREAGGRWGGSGPARPLPLLPGAGGGGVAGGQGLRAARRPLHSPGCAGCGGSGTRWRRREVSQRGSRAGVGGWGVRPPGPEGRGVSAGHAPGEARAVPGASPRAAQRPPRARVPGREVRAWPRREACGTRGGGAGGTAAGLGVGGGSRHLPPVRRDRQPSRPYLDPRARVTARRKPRFRREPHGAPSPCPACSISCPGCPSRPSLEKQGLVAAPLPGLPGPGR